MTSVDIVKLEMTLQDAGDDPVLHFDLLQDLALSEIMKAMVDSWAPHGQKFALAGFNAWYYDKLKELHAKIRVLRDRHTLHNHERANRALKRIEMIRPDLRREVSAPV